MDGACGAPVTILRARKAADFARVGVLASMLWPEHSPQEMAREHAQMDAAENALFLAARGEEAVGFAHASLRHDYVEGTDSSPVGYLEGVFVCEAYRAQGIARKLTDACMAWAKTCGCTQFASDCALENAQSIRMHRALGFEEAGRIVCFVRGIE